MLFRSCFYFSIDLTFFNNMGRIHLIPCFIFVNCGTCVNERKLVRNFYVTLTKMLIFDRDFHWL